MSLINQSSTHHLYRKIITSRSNKANAFAAASYSKPIKLICITNTDHTIFFTSHITMQLKLIFRKDKDAD